MQKPWLADIEVSVELATALIQSQFPTLTVTSITHFGEGWDNFAFMVNQTYIFRFPRRTLAAELIKGEIKVLPHLQGLLPLPIPNPIFVGQPCDVYPWSFVGYPLLPGRTACHVDLSDEQRLAIAAPLAQFLKTLHCVDANTAQAWGAGPDPIGRFDFAARIPRVHTLLEELEHHGVIIDLVPYYAICELTKSLMAPAASCLVHGDMYLRHLLIDEHQQLSGIIDWGDVHIGIPAVDLAIVHSFLPPSAHSTFLQNYGDISDNTWQLARFRALYSMLSFSHYAYNINDQHLLQEGRRGLEFLRTSA